eukprot:COSAG02_NODE_37349_length_443_cov_0.677326_1_plen_66_part_01
MAQILGHSVELVCTENDAGTHSLCSAEWQVKAKDPDGLVSFTIGGYRDDLGNMGPVISTTTDGSNV